MKEVAELLKAVIIEELAFRPPAFEATDAGDAPDEVRRQASEAHWQSLVYDPRA
jgi:hypothetical protein